MSETPLTRKAREAFAAFLDNEIMCALITEVERLTDLEITVRRLVAPPPINGTVDFIDYAKVDMYDELRHEIYTKTAIVDAECSRVHLNSPKEREMHETAPKCLTERMK